MSMTAKGIAKLIEECGELTAVLGKKLAYFDVPRHPDSEVLLEVRISDEIADVLASCKFVVGKLKLDKEYIRYRHQEKLDQYWQWDDSPENDHGVKVPDEI